MSWFTKSKKFKARIICSKIIYRPLFTLWKYSFPLGRGNIFRFIYIFWNIWEYLLIWSWVYLYCVLCVFTHLAVKICIFRFVSHEYDCMTTKIKSMPIIEHVLVLCCTCNGVFHILKIEFYIFFFTLKELNFNTWKLLKDKIRFKNCQNINGYSQNVTY